MPERAEELRRVRQEMERRGRTEASRPCLFRTCQSFTEKLKSETSSCVDFKTILGRSTKTKADNCAGKLKMKMLPRLSLLMRI